MTNKTKQKKLSFGGTVLVTPFTAGKAVSISGSVAGGYLAASSEELATVHAQMLLEGTTKRSKKDIQIALDTWGASLAFTVSAQRLRFAARVPVAHAAALLDLIAEILREPAFPEEGLAILKKREEAALTMEEQDTREQARVALSRLLYPKPHPGYSESTKESAASLATLTAPALRRFHASAHGSRSLIISFAGDLTAQKAFALTEKYFKTLPKTASKPFKTKAVMPHAAQTVVVPIEHKASIDYMIGLPTGITDTHADYPALVLGMQIFGNSGFTSRLMKIVREEEGLTYGVYAYTQNFANNVDGMLCVWGTFAPELFKQGRASIRREIERIATEGATDEEVHRHAELFRARAQVRFSNSSSIAALVHDTIANNKPLSYIDDLPKKILKLSPAQVNKVLKKYVLVKKMSESAAGPVDKNSL